MVWGEIVAQDADNPKTMKTLKILLLASVLMAGCCKEKAVEFAEFEVTDFSKPTLLVDSISGKTCDRWLFGGYFKTRIIITGELDGSAKVVYSSDTTLFRHTSFITTIQKGVLNDTIEGDHYYYQLWVKVIPIDCKKGHLNIKTKII